MPTVSFSVRSASPLHWGLFGAVVGLGLLMGCSAVSTGDEPLPDSTFTRVLTELHVASSRQSRDVATPPGLRDSIFARYDVKPSEFEAALRHYTRRPNRLEAMYQTVIDTLQALRSPNRRRSKPQNIPDSLQGRSQDPPDTP
ncbi:DUF4296 domain-containing protein [Salinibacter altiplanensis]|uniref:DUF4296 domain-containing protein n=1 Tax=Salinibacter altiplanensis TaxID=1803181 RepID=UPI000C9FB7C1|nr:DUF4296 domain-containing protein [Salinibacter altiplanensis]